MWAQNMRILLCLLIPALLCLSRVAGADEPCRTWKSTRGTTVEARLVQDAGGTVLLQTQAGQKFSIGRQFLSPEDRQYLDKISLQQEGDEQEAAVSTKPRGLSPRSFLRKPVVLVSVYRLLDLAGVGEGPLKRRARLGIAQGLCPVCE